MVQASLAPISLTGTGEAKLDGEGRVTKTQMAIGWGKSFEEQVEEASQRASLERAPRIPIEDRVREQRLHSINLSRSRIEQQLERATQPAHRAMLMKALQALEKEVEEIASKPASNTE